MEIYLDNSATTRVSPEVAQTVCNMMTEEFGNPSSLHRKGFLAERAVADARQTMASILGVQPAEVVFTSSGSESNSLAVVGAALSARHSGKKIVTTAIEHSSVMACGKHLESLGYQVTYVAPRSDGSVDPQAIAHAVDNQTTLVSVMHVNSETGAINDLEAIAWAVKDKNPKALVHSDCVQSFCKLPVTPKSWNVDMISACAHKIHGPKGVALLYAAKGVRLTPLTFGSAQEKGLHPGTENVPGICGFAEAAAQMWRSRKENTALFRQLSGHLKENICQLEGVCINSPQNGAPYIVNLSAQGIRSEVFIHYLEQFGIYVSSGSACSKGAKSHVLSAMELSPKAIDSALRVSLCRYNTIEEIDEFCARLRQGMQEIARSN
ncbi:MAG: cysteine desulfurase family protein [Angelakisella sp.]|nr:cysteine desulfurase family protein [Angelakisella sp.]